MYIKLNIRRLIRAPRFAVIAILFYLSVSPVCSQETERHYPVEISSGYGMLIYQSGYGLKNSYGVEIAAGKQLNEIVRTEIGIRLGLGPVQPDLYTRICAINRLGRWKPALGIETGYSNRMYFEGNNDLLKETIEAMTKERGFFYIASHAEILSFELKKQWNLSFLEIDFGTHYRNFGSTLRFQTNFIRIRKTL